MVVLVEDFVVVMVLVVAIVFVVDLLIMVVLLDKVTRSVITMVEPIRLSLVVM